MEKLIIMGLLVIAAVLLQWSYVMVGVFMVIAALIATLLFRQKNRVNIRGKYKTGHGRNCSWSKRRASSILLIHSMVSL